MAEKQVLKQDHVVVQEAVQKKDILLKTINFVRQKLDGEGSGHDWWHAYRVWQIAKKIALQEKADLFVVELASLLHDIADWKFYGGDESVGPRVAKEWLETLDVHSDVVEHVAQIIKDISFKGAAIQTPMKTKEGEIVQDADRLDAIGALGVARCFAYGGYMRQPMHDPNIAIEQHKTAQDYKVRETTSLNHFYEKLFLLKDRMNTITGRRIALERHSFMQQFVDKFLSEWEGRVE